jgi:Protein of unknown function (DUF3105)
MANRQTNGGRMTKAERRTQARLERAALQRKMVRAKRTRRIGLIVAVLAVVAVVVFLVFRPGPTVATPAELLRRAPAAMAAAGCGDVTNVGPYDPRTDDQRHISDSSQMPPLSSYPSVPPASGPHNQITLGAGIYDTPPPIDRVIHSLEHGAVVVWHSPQVGGPQLDALREFFSGPQGDRVIVAPFDYPAQGEAGRLPSGTSMALVAWHFVQECADVSLPASFEFASQYGAPPYGQREYLGEAPEAGLAF